MGVWIQYFHLGLGGALLPVCGDRGTVRLDGRRRPESWHEDARRLNGDRRPRYAAYRILRGRVLSEARPASDLINLPLKEAPR